MNDLLLKLLHKRMNTNHLTCKGTYVILHKSIIKPIQGCLLFDIDKEIPAIA